jgi:hypothetical protein
MWGWLGVETPSALVLFLGMQSQLTNGNLLFSNSFVAVFLKP